MRQKYPNVLTTQHTVVFDGLDCAMTIQAFDMEDAAEAAVKHYEWDNVDFCNDYDVTVTDQNGDSQRYNVEGTTFISYSARLL